MKTMHKNISTLLIILATLALLLVGCSDMMVKMGEIVLTIEAEDTIRTSVTKYKVTGSLEGGSKATIDLEVTMPANEVVVPNIAPGKWTFLVEAFDAAYSTDIPIGRGTQVINLVEGQKVGLKVPVEFMPLQLSISAPFFPDTLDKVYDGTTTLAVTSGDLSGLIDGYNRVRAEARATYADKGAGRDKAVTVSYDLVYDDATITNKYAPLADNIEYKGEIKQRQLTISAPIFPKTENKEYDGTNALAITAGDFTNLVEGDDVTVTAHAEYSDKNAEEAKVITITYTISGSDAANYITPVTDTTNTGTITKKPLTFTVEAEDKKYNGDVAAEGAITLAGMVPSDAGEVGATGTFAFSDKNVGSDKTVDVTDIELTGEEKENYSLSGTTASTTATISKKTFDMGEIGFKDASYTYNNEAFGLAISGTLPVGVSVSYSGNTGNIHVGTYEVTASFSVDEGNHETIDAVVATLTIEKKILTREGTYLKLSKPYDKNRTALFTLDQEKSGKVRGDEINLTVEAYYADASVGPNSITVSYTLTGDNIRNYTRPENYTESAGSITPKQLSLGAPSFTTKSKTYDGTTNFNDEDFSIATATLTGVYGSDVTLSATASYDDAQASSGKDIRVSYSLINGEGNKDNYIAPVDYITNTGVINKKELTVATDNRTIETSKVYDGSLAARVSSHGTLEGLISTEEKVNLETRASYNDKSVLNGKTISVSYSISGLDSGNYTVRQPSDAETLAGTITRKPLSVYANTTQVQTAKPYDGNTTASIIERGILEGIVGSDQVVLSTAAKYHDSANAGTDKGITVTYSLTDGADKDNYSSPLQDTRSFTGSITPKQLSLGAPSFTTKSKTYDGTTNFNDEDFSIATATLTGVYG
ncbi:MAG TPA: YDG domain-containing protein, partial [Sphaerochaeta sp.]|nr:YDG domain-containing protein [Sphaerochaeta sp.]